ncbi:hypothetical protein KY285_008053 [Solanum tuberosum]|nr:hypothetical protein KY285_008053 [Solanum tuberosum]
MEVEVDSQTNMVKEIKIGSPKRPSKKRKKESSNSEHTTMKQKENNGELHVGNDVALMCEMIDKETSEFVVRSMDNLKNLPNHKTFDNQSSSSLSNDDVLMRSLVKKEEAGRITNLDCHEAVFVLHQEVDNVEEGENKVFAHLNKSNELNSEFSQSVGKECSRPSKFDKLSSPNVSIDVLHLMSTLFQEVENTSFANLELQNNVLEDKVHREINDHVVETSANNEELTISFSYNEENMKEVPISQSLEIENNENTHMEKGLSCEDNYGEKEMIINLTNNVKFVTAADFTLDTGENDKEGVCITTNFALPEVAPPMKIDRAKEGNKTALEDSHGKEDHLISHDNIFTNMDNFDLFSPKEGLDDPFLLYGIENDDFKDAYTPNIKDM